MSDITANDASDLNIREQIVRIDRAIAETAKFQAEAAKFKRERFLAPILAAAALGGFIAAAIPAALRGWGLQ